MNKVSIRRALNFFLAPLGIEISRTIYKGIVYQQLHDPSTSFMKDKTFQNMLIQELAETADDFFVHQLNWIAENSFNLALALNDFWKIYPNRPFGHNRGGSSFHNAFWIYLFARAINPSLIIESGVWKGHTSWLMEQACPDSTIFGFDINMGNLEHRNGKVRFYEQDWSEYQFGNIDPEKSLVFFDCHVNHAKRILESREKGFRHILFDDNPPAHKLYGYNLPGLPTANMLNSGWGLDTTEISWKWQGKDKTYQINRDEAVEAKELIKTHDVFPDVGGPTRYGGFSFLTYVRI